MTTTDLDLTREVTNLRATVATRNRLWQYKLEHRHRTLSDAMDALMDAAGVPRR